jgi:hypothetical protein
MMTNDGLGLHPEDLAVKIGALRGEALFNEDGPHASPQAEQFYLLALSTLEQAERFATLAHYHLMKGE